MIGLSYGMEEVYCANMTKEEVNVKRVVVLKYANMTKEEVNVKSVVVLKYANMTK
jgi:hypothetical protein